MKKSFIFAACAVVAMASCTKNEVFVSEQNASKISFLPLAATQTKSSPVTEYVEGTGSFNVYAWYQSTALSANFDPSLTYTTYMANVTCSYKENVTSPLQKTWEPSSVYFWPKNGKLTFSAYYPATETVSVTADKGITVKDYTIADATNQVDLMFSNRAFDKTSSTATDGTAGKVYDGVDLVFNHALAAADFAVKTKADYGANAIKVYTIEIVDALSKGDFAEGYSTGKETDAPTAAWSNQSTNATYTVHSGTSASTIVVPTETAATAGETCILLPQDFSDAVKVKVTYGIKFLDGTTEKWLQQTAEFPLKGTKDAKDDTTINGWEMGKWYHYTLTFSLDTVYFAPSVTDWEDVNVTDIEVK